MNALHACHSKLAIPPRRIMNETVTNYKNRALPFAMSVSGHSYSFKLSDLLISMIVYMAVLFQGGGVKP